MRDTIKVKLWPTLRSVYSSTFQLGVGQPRNDLRPLHPRTGHEGLEGE